MSTEVLDATMKSLINEDLLEESLAISWHGAEPLAAGLTWYHDAFARVAKFLDEKVHVTHIFQTNGTLITDDWCRFFIQHGAQVGVSMDGSERQNAARVNWAGRPAHRLAMRGIERLNRHAIPWTLLSVVTHETMSDPDAFIRFVRESGCRSLGFKVEETNVAHKSNLEEAADVERLYGAFARAVWRAFPPEGPLPVREFQDYISARRSTVKTQVLPVTLIPLRNLTVAINGDFTIFSGELLFRQDSRFVFGNVLTGPLTDSLKTDRFKAISAEILAGVRRCAARCSYYSDCGSFYISQKHAETGSFDAEETLACRLEIKTLFRSLDTMFGDATY